MSSNPQQQPPQPRRVSNVGSLLLTPQENESLFSFLGKKCVVSPGPRRRGAKRRGRPAALRGLGVRARPHPGRGGPGEAGGV